MSDSGATPNNGSGKSSTGKLLLGLLLIGITVAIFMLTRPNPGGPGGGGQGGGGGGGSEEGDAAERLELTRTALAATENLEMSAADQSWTQLFQADAQDSSIALNRAINRVLRVDQLSAEATNASLNDAAKKAARAQLPEAITGAREAVDAFAMVADDLVMPIWLASRIDLHEASLLPGSMTKSLRMRVYKRLTDAVSGEVGQDPTAVILGGTLINVVDQLEDPIDGLPSDLLAEASKTVGALSDQHTDNLFFALRAARLNIAAKNAKAVDYVNHANQLASAIEPSIRRDTKPIGVTPDELVEQITSAIEAEKWSEAENRMLLWFNVLNSTEIVKTDRRRASPHPLDRLSFDSLRRLSARVVDASPLEKGSTEITFQSQVLDAGQQDIESIQVVDFDLDLDPDLLCLREDGTIELWQNDTDAWKSAGSLKLENKPRGVIAADLFLVDSSNPDRFRADRETADGDEPDYSAAVRHNTLLNLVAYGPSGAQIISIDGRSSASDENRLKLVDVASGLEDASGIVAAVAGDLEADGDLDLILATESGLRLFANRGNRTFFELAQATPIAGDDPVTALAIADIDRDLDLDLVTAHAGSGRVGLLENLLHLQFRHRYLDDVPKVEEASSIAVEDVDGNVSWDLIVGGKSGSLIAFSQTASAGAWTVDRIKQSQQPAAAMVAADFDNDSWLEILSPDASSQITRIGPRGIGEATPLKNLAAPAGVVLADFNADGLIDVAGVSEKQIHLWTNQTASAGHHVDVRFKGIDDNASGRVNHFAIGSVLELRFGPHYRARIVRSPQTHFGTDGFDAASSVRAILPNGLTQTVRDPKIDSLVEEEQTLKGSCPYLYAWDGEKYVFQTDCLWAAPLGLQVARGVVAKDRPWEYLKIDGSRIRPNGDHYDFRITEELWEVAYFDHVALQVVDHPADVDVWTNEKVGPSEIATPTLFAFSKDDLRPLVRGRGTDGSDVTEKLAETDRSFVQGFDRRIRQGLCPPHWIDLDFGDVAVTQDDSVYLVLTGWILPTDTSLNIQIDQNPDLGPLEFPSVWVPDADDPDQWNKVIPFMGFPGGKTKTIVVDVSDVIRRDDPRFRIRTSAQIYWDSAKIAVQSEPAEFQVQDLELLAADVTYHGFSKPIRDELTHPETYDYQQAFQTPRWPPLQGSLTQFGDCIDLIRQWDNAMAVISSGDEIRLRFSLPERPLPAGWKRDFVLHSVGWDKDADLNTLAGQSTGPLPSREMTQYPPPAGQAARQQQLEQLNRDHLQRYQSFRAFWYRAEPPGEGRFLDAATTVQ